jgi:hypothetical protein
MHNMHGSHNTSAKKQALQLTSLWGKKMHERAPWADNKPICFIEG